MIKVPFQAFIGGTWMEKAPPSRVPLQIEELQVRSRVTLELFRTALVCAGTEVEVHAEMPTMTATTATIARTLIALPDLLVTVGPCRGRVASKILPSARQDVAILVDLAP
jgi:hypothetical protein